MWLLQEVVWWLLPRSLLQVEVWLLQEEVGMWLYAPELDEF